MDPIITNTPRPGDTPEQIAARSRMPLLQEREKTHGSFALNAAISQQLKKCYELVYLDEKGLAVQTTYEQLSSVHKEALDMIALKLSRILSGQADYKDHWDDIAGYAKLASEACQQS